MRGPTPTARSRSRMRARPSPAGRPVRTSPSRSPGCRSRPLGPPLRSRNLDGQLTNGFARLAGSLRDAQQAPDFFSLRDAAGHDDFPVDHDAGRRQKSEGHHPLDRLVFDDLDVEPPLFDDVLHNPRNVSLQRVHPGPRTSIFLCGDMVVRLCPWRYITALKRYPTVRMPAATTATNAAMSAGRRTFRRMIMSGSESAITDIMKARTVPSAAPLPRSAWTTGMIPAAFEYIGTPSSTASGTAHQASRPMKDAMKFVGT